MVSEDRPAFSTALLVVLASVLALAPSWINYDIIANDGAFQYIPVAELFLQGRFRDALLTPQLPLFPLAIAGMSFITGLDPELSGRLVAALAFIVAALGIYRLGMLTAGQRRVALLAVLFLVTNRELVQDSVDCLKESLLAALIVWGNVWILRCVQGRITWHLLAGVSLLLAGGLLRSTALFFIGAWLILWAFHRRRGLVLRVGLIASPVAAVLVLWLIDPTLPIFIRSYNLGLIFKPEHTPLFLLTAAGKTVNEFLATGNPLVMLFAFAGLYRMRAGAYARHATVVLLIYLLIMVMWGHVFSGRYLLAPIVWVYPLAACTVYEAWRSRRTVWKMCAGLAVISCLALWGYQTQIPPDPDKLAWKQAGQWIGARIGPGREVMSNRARLAFYAKGTALSLEDVKAGGPHPCIAVDVATEEGRKFKANYDQAGLRADAVFRSVYVYLPES